MVWPEAPGETGPTTQHLLCAHSRMNWVCRRGGSFGKEQIPLGTVRVWRFVQMWFLTTTKRPCLHTHSHLVTNKRQTAIYSHRSLAILVHNIPLHYDFLTFHWMYALIHALQHTELRDVVLDHVPSCHIILYHFPFHDIQQLNHIAEGYLTSLSVWQYTVHTLPNICYHTMTNTA